MRNDLAHFTISGQPLCDCQYPATAERIRAAGSPPCSDLIPAQLQRFANLAEQFPGRVALVHGGCPAAAQDGDA